MVCSLCTIIYYEFPWKILHFPDSTSTTTPWPLLQKHTWAAGEDWPAQVLKSSTPTLSVSSAATLCNSRLVRDEGRLAWKVDEIGQQQREVEAKSCNHVGQFPADLRGHAGGDANILLDHL